MKRLRALRGVWLVRIKDAVLRNVVASEFADAQPKFLETERAVLLDDEFRPILYRVNYKII